MQKKKKGEKENKQKTNGHGKHGEERKNRRYNTTTELPTNTPTLSKINETDREKSKSRKVNRNSAGLCTF